MTMVLSGCKETDCGISSFFIVYNDDVDSLRAFEDQEIRDDLIQPEDWEGFLEDCFYFSRDGYKRGARVPFPSYEDLLRRGREDQPYGRDDFPDSLGGLSNDGLRLPPVHQRLIELAKEYIGEPDYAIAALGEAVRRHNSDVVLSDIELAVLWRDRSMSVSAGWLSVDDESIAMFADAL